MRKHFNTTGLCYPKEHYMVDMKERLEEIKVLVGRGEYFAINRARQYGKTTTLHQLVKRLCADYALFSVSFEGIEDEVYRSADTFCRRFCRLLYKYLLYHEIAGIPDSLKAQLKQMRDAKMDLEDLSDFISGLCAGSDKRVVLVIDEVDQAGNQRIFLTFLGMLRQKFLARKTEPTFHSVILAGVYDIKNLKLKVRPETQHQYNSPWNIASDFTLDMSFSVQDIVGMLTEYEQDFQTGMDIWTIAGILYEYTSGYPFLVSWLCKIMDENMYRDAAPGHTPIWTKDGVTEAVKVLLGESNTLFDDMVKKMDDFPELRRTLYAILFNGERISYSASNHIINLGIMFGFLKEDQESIAVSNRIFEMRLYNLFLSEELLDSAMYRYAAYRRYY